MTPDARAYALMLAVAVAAVAFVLGAAVTYLLATRIPTSAVDAARSSSVADVGHARHLKVTAHRHRLEPRHEWLMWTVSTVARWVRSDDGGPKAAVTFAALALTFSVLLGVNA